MRLASGYFLHVCMYVSRRNCVFEVVICVCKPYEAVRTTVFSSISILLHWSEEGREGELGESSGERKGKHVIKRGIWEG